MEAKETGSGRRAVKLGHRPLETWPARLAAFARLSMLIRVRYSPDGVQMATSLYEEHEESGGS